MEKPLSPGQMPNRNAATMNLPNSSDKTSRAPQSLNTNSLSDLRQQFPGGARQIIDTFSPDKQMDYCCDIWRVHFGRAPKLGAVAKSFGIETAETWLAIQIRDLSEFSGCANKLKPGPIKELADLIINRYPAYNLAEFMLFFHRFKQCRYGRFFGSVDPMAIFAAFETFGIERGQMYAERQRRQDEERRAAEERQEEELRSRYRRRVPDAFTPKAPLSFTQYRLMGFDYMDDAELTREITAIRRGHKRLPSRVFAMLGYPPD